MPPTTLETSDVALRLESVTMAFGGIVAVNDLSITVPRGMRGTVIGPNGAGKTTLFRIISGEVLPTSGRVTLFGKDVTRRPPYYRARLGLSRTFQVTQLFSNLTVEENVVLAAKALESSRYQAWLPLRLRGELADRVDDALRTTHMADLRRFPVKELSHGQHRQLELAMGIVSNPQLLLLDEPAAGLTSSERELIWRLVAGLPGDITVLIIEHDLDLAFGLAERILCMDNGRLIADGTPEEIRADARVQEIYMGAG